MYYVLTILFILQVCYKSKQIRIIKTLKLNKEWSLPQKIRKRMDNILTWDAL